jgi:4-hydroxythreonine-4-phosphate dehydrogenase
MEGWGSTTRRIVFLDLAHPWPFEPGQSSARAGAASLAYLDAAIQLWRQGLTRAVVTAPVTKWAIERTGRRFVGQTEYLASALGASFVVMMFVSSRLRVALLTRHLALREVSSRVTRTLVRKTCLLTMDGLRRWFGIRAPRLAVCGLNPHAGEAGLFGHEERRVLRPVLRAFKHDAAVLDGPFAADSLFADPRGYDAVICCYHDQGLIPFKLMARHRGCQFSLGLPIVRTSPAHGTALDIAGKGLANPGSMRYAIELAANLIQRKQ